MKTPPPFQFEGHDEGIDGVGSSELDKESEALARQDGRDEARDSDRELAFRELTGPEGHLAQEIPRGAEGLVTWDSNPEETGHLIEEVPSDDEASIAAEEAEEGRVEAEEELRNAVDEQRRLPRGSQSTV
jgi:hypothetical protein